MKFEIIDNRELDLTGKGYKWTNDPMQFDRECSTTSAAPAARITPTA